MEKSAKKIDALRNRMSELASEKLPTQDYKDVSKQIADAEKKQAALNDRMEKFVELGGKTNSRQYKSMQYDAAELANTIKYAKGELQDLVETGAAFRIGSSSAEFASLGKQLSDEQAKLNELTRQYGTAQRNVESSEKIKGISKGLASISGIAKRTFSIISSGAKAAGKAFQSIGSVLGTVSKGLAKFAGSAMSALNGIGRHSKKSGNSLGHFGKRIFELAKSAFIFNILSAGFRQVSSGIGTAFQSYLSYDAGLKGAINGLRAQLSALQGSLASAFAPIISAVVPYLSTLISWVTAAANAVAQFIAVITGHSSYKRAVSNIGAVGAAADGTAGSLGDATKAAEELEKALGDYDELKVIEQPKESSGGSGGSGGGAGGGAGEITYEDVEIASAISDFAEKVKEAWKNSDFTEVGGIIGQKLNDALEAIPWDNIQNTAKKIGKSAATLINGAIETSGLGDTVGKTVGGLLNTGIAGVNAFMTNLHWGSAGQFVADSMNSFVKTADWKGIGETVRTSLNGVFKAGATWSAGFDFSALGSQISSLISTSLNGISWSDAITFSSNVGTGIANALNKVITKKTMSSVGKTFAGMVNTVISGAHSLIGTIEWKEWGTAIGNGINSFFADLDWHDVGLTFSDAVEGILSTLCSAVTTISWSQVGTDIATALQTVDWSGILQAAADLVGSTFTGLLDFGSAVLTRLGGNEWDNYLLDVKEVTKELSNANTEIENRIKKASEWSEAGEEYDYAHKLAEEYFDLADKEILTNDEKDRMKDLAGELVETVPELETYYNTETGLLDTTRDSVNNLIESLKAKARTEAAQDALKEFYAAQMKAKESMDEAQKKIEPLVKENEKLNEQLKYYNRLAYEATQKSEEGADAAGGYSTEIANLQGRIDENNAAIKENNKEYERANQAYQDAQTEIDKVTTYLTTYGDTADVSAKKTEGLSKKTYNLAEKLKNLSKESQIIISVKGMNASYEEKIKVIAEVTGTDYSNMPVQDKVIDDAYAEIVEAYTKRGYTPVLNSSGNIIEAKADKKLKKTEVDGKANVTEAKADKKLKKTEVEGKANVTEAKADNKLKKTEVEGKANVTEAKADKKLKKTEVEGRATVTETKAGTKLKPFETEGTGIIMEVEMNPTSNLVPVFPSVGEVKEVRINSDMVRPNIAGFTGVLAQIVMSMATKKPDVKGLLGYFAKLSLNSATKKPGIGGLKGVISSLKLVSKITKPSISKLKGFISLLAVNARAKRPSVSGLGGLINTVSVATRITKPIVSAVGKFISYAQSYTPTISVRANISSTAQSWAARGWASGGVFSNGIWSTLPQKANGGILSHNTWKSIPKFAGGGAVHGTMFVAGEAGPEIVGHVGGRTEVLNKSQIASAIYSAVTAAMRQSIGDVVRATLQHMTECTTMVISNIGMISDQIQGAAMMQNMIPQVQFAGNLPGVTIPDVSRINAYESGVSGGCAIDVDKLAGAVASRISNDSTYQFIATLNGKTIFDETVRQNKLVIKQTGKSAFDVR